MALTALAGPLSNVIVALAFALPYRLGLPAAPEVVTTFVQRLVLVNLLLAAFNLIPIPPLDGLKILLGILPAFWYPVLAPLERYGVGILLVLIVFGSLGEAFWRRCMCRSIVSSFAWSLENRRSRP